MTNEVQELVVVSDFSAGHYLFLYAPDDPGRLKSPSERSEAARSDAIRQQRQAQSARYRQRIAQKRQAA